jgi:hypothetical protein
MHNVDDEFYNVALSRTKLMCRQGNHDQKALAAASYILGFEDAFKALARLRAADFCKVLQAEK